MATGLIACMGASQTASYTAQNNCKVSFLCCSTATGASLVTVNGVSVLSYANSDPVSGIQQYAYLGAGQTINVATAASSYCIISCYEG